MHDPVVRALTYLTYRTVQRMERRMTEGFETVDQELDREESAMDQLTADEQKELEFLADLQANRGAGQLSPAQQQRYDELMARFQAADEALVTATTPEQTGTTVPPSDPADPSDPTAPAGDGTPVDGDVPIAPAPVDGGTTTTGESGQPVAESTPAE